MSRIWIRRLSSLNHNIRTLLRDTAQSVAVVTSHMPREHIHLNPQSKFHGATLSSFSSIALDPHPLIAFSLRVPSRMASSLQASDPDSDSDMVINILSAAQAHTAAQFAKPDLHPFTSCPHSLSPEGLPILHDSLGAISCKLIAPPWPLHDLRALDRRKRSGSTLESEVEMWAPDWDGAAGVASELFIARVVRVEHVALTEANESLRTLPLLYHRRGYVTVNPLPLQ